MKHKIKNVGISKLEKKLIKVQKRLKIAEEHSF